MSDFLEFEDDETLDEDENVVEYDIVSSPRDLTPASIVDMVDAGLIELPLFQRNYVWDQKKASKLIESLLLGLPVPELFFYSEGDENTTYKIIDGQQRLLTIYFFMKGRFPKNNGSRLEIRNMIDHIGSLDKAIMDDKSFVPFELILNVKGEQEKSPLDGLTYSQLERDLQIKFRLRRFLRTVVVRQNKPNDDSSSMFEIFNRLNTGGAPLNHQEVRASLYYCDFYNMIINLNENEKWRKYLHNSAIDLHCLDVELILRAFAMLEDLDNYVPRIVSFLNRYSQKSKKFDKEHIVYLKNLFYSFLESCEMLGENAFFRNNRFSKILFETVFVIVCMEAYKKHGYVEGKIDVDSFNRLKNDDMFISYLQASSASQANVDGRMEIARNIISMVKEK